MDGQDLLKVSRMYVSVFRSNFPFPASLEEDAVQEVALRLLESEKYYKPGPDEAPYLKSRYAKHVAFRTIREATLLHNRPVSGPAPRRDLKQCIAVQDQCRRVAVDSFDVGSDVIQFWTADEGGNASRRAGTEAEQVSQEDVYFNKEERELAKKLLYFPGVNPKATQRFEAHLKNEDETKKDYSKRSGMCTPTLSKIEEKALKKMQRLARELTKFP